ncbi:flagellar basal body rod protein FlgG [Clostridium swellfunianum]|uniref:flagellar hook-basal body complex protein n=1 Tax=Clostridium swellfunianum TaxID=1367462 RepID=UPI00202FB94C|nr:flagellar hook-basal body complex protein [Clostridium swellfunianum]MCM0650429.1 flagellar basal body rod protein FlgG [Clostridium swellfunianum]
MLRILWGSRSSMTAQQEKLDSISNNIANVNTEGYKKVDVSFKDLVYETLNRNGYPTNVKDGASSINGTGVRTADWTRDASQGNLSETTQKTDLAIDGQGYFAVELPEKNADGSSKLAYTRSGSFNLDADGSLVDKNGNRLFINFYEGTQQEDKQFTKDNFTVDEQGRVIKTDGNVNKEVGKINLYNVVGQDSLRSIGNSLYVIDTQNINGVEVPVERPYLEEDSSIRQGLLELSNVDLTKEMTEMIVTQRAFELSSKAMRTADEMWGMANNLRGR